MIQTVIDLIALDSRQWMAGFRAGADAANDD